MITKGPGKRQSRGADKAPIGILVLAIAASVVGLLLLVLMVSAAPVLVRWGLVGHLWFVLLVALGLCAATVTFGVLRSKAYYSGKVLNGKLEMGGPPVVMFVVVVAGFFFVPAPAGTFDLTVFFKGEGQGTAEPLNISGNLQIDIEGDRRIEAIGKKSEVRFVGIPSNQKGKVAPVMLLDSALYALTDADPNLTLEIGAHYLKVRTKLLSLTGLVADPHGNPVSDARVALAGKTTKTDDDGHFVLQVPANTPAAEHYIVITAPGFAPYRGAAVPGGSVQVRLER